MTIYFLRIFGFYAENELSRHQTFCFLLCREDQLRLIRYTDLSRVLKYMADCWHAIDVFLHDGILIDALSSKNTEEKVVG